MSMSVEAYKAERQALYAKTEKANNEVLAGRARTLTGDIRETMNDLFKADVDVLDLDHEKFDPEAPPMLNLLSPAGEAAVIAEPDDELLKSIDDDMRGSMDAYHLPRVNSNGRLPVGTVPTESAQPMVHYQTRAGIRATPGATHECEHGCGFVGHHDQVLAHEATCNFISDEHAVAAHIYHAADGFTGTYEQVEAHEEKHGLHWDEHGGHDPPPPRGGHKRSEASDTDNDNDNTRGRSRNESNANSDGSAAAGRGEVGGEAEAKREGGPSDAEIEAIFRKFDTSGDGFMDLDEMAAAMKQVGQEMSEEEVKALVNKVDKDGDGTVSLSEWKEVIKLAMSGERGDGADANADPDARAAGYALFKSLFFQNDSFLGIKDDKNERAVRDFEAWINSPERPSLPASVVEQAEEAIATIREELLTQ